MLETNRFLKGNQGQRIKGHPRIIQCSRPEASTTALRRFAGPSLRIECNCLNPKGVTCLRATHRQAGANQHELIVNRTHEVTSATGANGFKQPLSKSAPSSFGVLSMHCGWGSVFLLTTLLRGDPIFASLVQFPLNYQLYEAALTPLLFLKAAGL
jgi:hypothetical protein